MPPGSLRPRRSPLMPTLVAAGLGLGQASGLAAATDTGATDRIAALITALGDEDYHRREAAAAELKSLGPGAIDALLAAAETDGDLEVALRARWLVEAIPLDAPHDPPEVAKLLARFKRREFPERVQAMHRLLRVDGDAGIEPLARVVRLDPSTAGSRVAAALLAREWRDDDPDWPHVRRRIESGLGPSTRPSARFLSSLVAFSGTRDQSDRAAALATAAEALGDLRSATSDDADAGNFDEQDERVVVGHTGLIFERCHVRMLAAAGRRDAAVTAAAALITASLASIRDPDDDATDCVDAIAWAVEAGLPEAVEAILAERAFATGRPVVNAAIAHAERARGREAAAAARFTATLEPGAKPQFIDRLQAAILLARWGRVDWAVQCYDSLLAAESGGAEAALAAIMYSEFLHDLGRDREAADCLRRIFPADDGNDGRVPALEQLGRDPRTIRSRMHFFDSCARAAAGDAAGCREALERALAAYPKDVDALIAIYAFPDSTPEQRSDAVRRIRLALARIEEEIQAVPDPANEYNEYAWLVANTEGDLEKAVRYSKLSLVKSFDNSSYLDTLAHCHAAAGRYDVAVRTQRLARRNEPHNRTIQRNLARFEKLAQ